jgi:hypothetical protein
MGGRLDHARSSVSQQRGLPTLQTSILVARIRYERLGAPSRVAFQAQLSHLTTIVWKLVVAHS